ncbi:hypothetical protein UCRPC4_g01896 [Phaeomoniella chlamydospora]|uniref:Uncharacterized protein n=1 Tax=Phaeomoniella chlamydospora TaxID=158046 RepID=A0A0G2ER45_PHACM|nr:hypothetical protein UCRPC4_g01896 [Phaeomoniella chlamydospora]
MLDENLPTFLITPLSERSKQESTILFTQYGAERSPAYTLRKPDPTSPNSKNRYAVAIYDAFNPDVLFAEVLLIPEWTQPTLSTEQIRKNGGVPPPPEPILPTEFTIQLYNPDQQVIIRQKKSKSFSSTPTWYFDMPLRTFREPSNSTLDRAQSDPVASEVTPKLGFKWKKDSKLSKDLACFSSGRTTNPDGTKKRSKEPDITVAIFQHLREVTLYEPNMQRIEIEDHKGFEVVVLLGAVVIRDVYFGHMTETFNISDPPKPQNPADTPGFRPGPSSSAPPTSSHHLRNGTPSKSTTAMNQASGQRPTRPSRVPPTDPRSQWEIDAETARLRQQAEAEKREQARREAAEQKQIKRMLEAEEKEKRRKQAEVEKETERLKRIYGDEQRKAEATLLRPNAPPRNDGGALYSRHSAPNVSTTRPFTPQNPSGYHQSHQQQPQRVSFAPQPSFIPPQGTYQPYPGGPYLSTPDPSTSTASSQKLKEKKSFFGFGGSSGGRERTRSGSGFEDLTPDGSVRLHKKKSSMF